LAQQGPDVRGVPASLPSARPHPQLRFAGTTGGWHQKLLGKFREEERGEEKKQTKEKETRHWSQRVA
jgi:hypothetical protein